MPKQPCIMELLHTEELNDNIKVVMNLCVV